jgi:hypothetical protein
VEHAAEAIVIWIMFGAVVGAMAGGSVTHIVGISQSLGTRANGNRCAIPAPAATLYST